MSLAYYFDVHVPLQIARALRKRDIDVLTAQDDSTTEFSDSDLMDRATELNRVLVSQDDDMLHEANVRQASGKVFSGLIYGHQRQITIGQAFQDLFLFSETMSQDEMINRVEYLPL